jgi:CubicO group peptidase (beta-lactamase class C family)
MIQANTDLLCSRRVFCLAALAMTQTARSEPAKSDTLDRLIGEALRAWRVPGAAVVIVRDGNVEYLAGHGVRTQGEKEPVTPKTLFPLGSCSKAFTTAGLAMLVKEGKLSWDDHVRKHVSFFRLSDPLVDSRVVLRDLLCHRTGLATHDLLWYRAPWTPEESVRRAGALPLARPFRTAFQYQSTMFTAAGFALESAAGQKWNEFIQSRLFDPLGMKTAGYTTTAFKTDDRASGHRIGANREVEALAEWCPGPRPDAASTIHANAADLAGWLKMQLDPAQPLAETHTPQMVIPLVGREGRMHPDTNQMSYGMAWVIQDYKGHKVVAHSGILDGFRVQLTLVPKAKLGFAVLANLHGTRMNLALSYTLLDRLLGLERRDWHTHLLKEVRQEEDEIARKQNERLKARHQGTRPSRELAAYAKSYQHPAYGTARISREHGRLVFHWGSFHSPLDHYQYDTFSVQLDPLGPCLLTFALDAAGDVAEMSADNPLGVTFKAK